MAVLPLRIRAKYVGRCIVPEEPVDLPENADLDVVISVRARTLAELRLGIPPVVVTGEGLSASEIIIQERGPA